MDNEKENVTGQEPVQKNEPSPKDTVTEASTETSTDGNDASTGEDGKTGGKKRAKVRQTYSKKYNLDMTTLDLSATDPTLIGFSTQYGYPPERIQTGTAMGTDLGDKHQAFREAVAKQVDATEKFQAKKRKASATTKRLWDLAEVVFKDDTKRSRSLGLEKPLPRTYGEWRTQYSQFFTYFLGNPTAQLSMEGVGVTLDQIQAGNTQLKDTMAAYSARENLKAEAQKASELKSKAQKAFSRWMRRYRNVMSAALEDDPQMKEKLGIITPREE